MMICYYLYFLIDEISLDLHDNILLGIILFSVLAKFNLICSIWAFQIIQDRPLGLADWAFVLGWHKGAWILHWVHHFFGLGEWAYEPIFLTLSEMFYIFHKFRITTHKTSSSSNPMGLTSGLIS